MEVEGGRTVGSVEMDRRTILSGKISCYSFVRRESLTYRISPLNDAKAMKQERQPNVFPPF